MQKYLLIVGISLLLSSCASNLITAARIAEQRGEYKEAITHCLNELKVNPKNVEAYLIMARCRVFLNNQMEASDDIDKAFALDSIKTKKQILDPNDRASYWRIYSIAAFSLIDAGKLPEALKKAEMARYLDDKKAETYVALGVIWSGLKDNEKMRDAFNTALKLDSTSAEAYLYLGNESFFSNKYDQALPHYEKSIGFYRQRREKALKNILKNAPTLNPEEVENKIIELQGKSIEELNEYCKTKLGFDKGVQDVARYVESLINAYSSLSIVYFRAAACAYNLGKLDKAEEYFAALVSLDPKSRDGLFWYGQILIRKDNFNKAKDMFNRILEIKKDDKEALFSLGYTYLRLENYDKAIETLEEKYLLLDSENAEAYTNLAIAYKAKKNIKKAFEYIKKADELLKKKGGVK